MSTKVLEAIADILGRVADIADRVTGLLEDATPDAEEETPAPKTRRKAAAKKTASKPATRRGRKPEPEPEEDEEDEPLTIDSVREVMTEVGRAKSVKTLKAWGADSVKDIEEDSYQDFITDLRAA